MTRQRRLDAYVALVVVVAATGLIYGATTDATAPGGIVLVELLLFGGLYVVAELFPIRVYSRSDAGSFTTSAAFAYALLLSVPLTVALLVIPVGSLAGDIRNRRPLVRTLFNAGQQTLAFGLGGLVLDALLQGAAFGPDDTVGLELVLALIPSGGAMYVANILLTGVAIALHNRVRLRSVLAEEFAPIDVLGHFMLLGLAPIFVVVTQRTVLLAPLLFLTVLAVYRSTQAALRRQHESLHDQLTGLANRRHLDARLAELAERSRREDEGFAVLLVDLDRFKDVNDTLGHHVGDLLLVAVADRLAGVAGLDTVARLGGDEFALLVSDVVDPTAVEVVAAEVVEVLGSTFHVQGFPLHIGGSVGVAIAPMHGREAEVLLRRADAAMYAAKRSGAGFLVADTGAEQVGPGRVSLLADLPDALADGQITLHYQPKCETRTGRVVGFEALVRWAHPVLGPLDPSVFVPMVEHTDLIGEFTARVLRGALRECAVWRAHGHHDLHVAVNVSAADLQDLRFPERVAEALDLAGLPASALELEITENSLLSDHARVGQVLATLRALGVTLSIDDFGTGFSSLAHLRSLPIEKVKVDRSFVTGMLGNTADALIVESVVHLAHGMGMRVVAEGVEDLGTLQRLTSMGCEETQGYLLSRPIGPDGVLAWLLDHEVVPLADVAVVEVAP